MISFHSVIAGIHVHNRSWCLCSWHIQTWQAFTPILWWKNILYFQDITPIHHVWVNKVWVIAQPDTGRDFVSFPLIKPLVAVYQMLPQTVFLPSVRWIWQNPFSETVWVAPSCLPPCTRWEPPLTQITEVRWKKAACSLSMENNKGTVLHATLLFSFEL